jgi:1,2-diacylglycerol 3-alpha-glucosyltransferase
VVFSGAIAYPSGAASVRWSNENGKHCVIFDNARIVDVPRGYLTNFVKKKIYSAVGAIFCPSPAWNETFHFFGFRDDQIFYGLNVVDNSFWINGSYDGSIELPWRYFLTVGRQIPKKNLLFLLQSYFEYCKSAFDPAFLVIVGNGPKRNILESFVKEKNMQKVIMLPFCRQEKLRYYYRNALCFILPSKFGETWGLVVNEAMASSLPVLVSDQVGCASTLIREGINGYTFSPLDKWQMASLLLKLDKMPEADRTEMGSASLRIINNWGYERFCTGVFDILEYLKGTSPRNPDFISRILIKLWKGRYRPS